MTSAMFASMIVFFALSIPIAVAIGFSGTASLFLFTNSPMLVIPK